MYAVLIRFRRKESLHQLLRVTTLSVQITHLYLLIAQPTPQNTLKLKAALDYLKLVNSLLPLCMAPRAFQSIPFDKPPHADKLQHFRVVLLALYAKPRLYERFNEMARAYVSMAGEGSVVQMLTCIGEVAAVSFRGYKQYRAINIFQARLRKNESPEFNLDNNLSNVETLLRQLARLTHAHVLQLICVEQSTSVLNVTYLASLTNVLRMMAVLVGDFTQEDTSDGVVVDSALVGMQVCARFVVEGFSSETGRRDLWEWSMFWFRRQMEIDHQKMSKNYGGNDAVGQFGLM